MSRLSEVVAVFPANELTVYRLYTKSETFRTVCTDYLEASDALKFWRSAAATPIDKVEDYRRIMEELEKEIVELIARTERSEQHRRK